MKNLKEFKNVKYSKPFELFFLLMSTFGILLLLIKVFMSFFDNKMLSIISALISSIIYFVFIKNKIIKKSDFNIYENQIEWKDNKVEFENIKSYKIHWMKGAGLKMKLKNGKTIRLSANSNFHNSKQFVLFCKKLDSILRNYKNGMIERKKSFYETKFGYYFIIIILILSTLTFILSFFRH